MREDHDPPRRDHHPDQGIWHVAPFTYVPGIVWFILKMAVLFFLMSMVKAIVPRYRYDQLMRLGWKVFLPISLVWVVVTAGWVMVFPHGIGAL